MIREDVRSTFLDGELALFGPKDKTHWHGALCKVLPPWKSEESDRCNQPERISQAREDPPLRQIELIKAKSLGRSSRFRHR